MARVSKNKKTGQKCPNYFESIEHYSEKQYSHIINQGYKWYSNISLDQKEIIERELRSKGLEVYVGGLAFDFEGNVLNNFRSFFIRKKGN